jgi:hypothetical protein
MTAARELGREMAARGVGLVYGGGKVGLMGAVAEAVVAGGGAVTGVIPRGLLAREVGFEGLADLRVVDTMHERKAIMSELADAFVALPGGIGTFEELFEVLTWSMLGIHDKPVALLDVEGYQGPLVALLDQAVREGFLTLENRERVALASGVTALFAAMASYSPPPAARWLTGSET